MDKVLQKRLIAVGVGLLAILFVFVTVQMVQSHAASNKVKQASDAFLSSLLAGKTSDSYNDFTPAAKKQLAEIDWNDQVLLVSTTFAGQKPTLLSQTSDKTSATLTYSITSNDTDYTFTTKLVQTATQWQIQSFNSVQKT